METLVHFSTLQANSKIRFKWLTHSNDRTASLAFLFAFFGFALQRNNLQNRFIWLFQGGTDYKWHASPWRPLCPKQQKAYWETTERTLSFIHQQSLISAFSYVMCFAGHLVCVVTYFVRIDNGNTGATGPASHSLGRRHDWLVPTTRKQTNQGHYTTLHKK